MYLSPLHHRDFVASMANNLNDTYMRFFRRNPTFKARLHPTNSLVALKSNAVIRGIYRSNRNSARSALGS